MNMYYAMSVDLQGKKIMILLLKLQNKWMLLISILKSFWLE
jgi:hypothetical protein